MEFVPHKLSLISGASGVSAKQSAVMESRAIKEIPKINFFIIRFFIFSYRPDIIYINYTNNISKKSNWVITD